MSVLCFGCCVFVFAVAYSYFSRIDLDECVELNNICGNHSICNNTAGSYNCDCERGFYRLGNQCRGVLFVLYCNLLFVGLRYSCCYRCCCFSLYFYMHISNIIYLRVNVLCSSVVCMYAVHVVCCAFCMLCLYVCV